ncbi:sensor histidine kinase [Actinophytocola oryzae]|uniref:sensor histidine kinase n=1 Tax=Actinophytocola oryzae TaxID=502181 RepID=UPI0010643745|nr:ATP-binding protein [Actinophytocola oryzae]
MLVVSALASLAFAVGGALRWSRPPAVAAIALSVLVTVLYRGPGNNTTAAWLLVETAGQLVVLASATRRAPVLAPFGVAAIAASPLRIGLWLSPPSPVTEVVGVCAVWALLAVAAVGVGVYLRSLDRARARAVELARREQRLHLARNLHDWLAHEMTGVVLAAQAGRLDDTDPDDAFRQIEEAGTRGLEAMDRALRLLGTAADGTAEVTTLDEVRAAVDRFAAGTRAEVTCDITLPEPRREITATLHRVVLEALTNVRRHARTATSVRVLVTGDGNRVVAEVTNDGGGGRSFGRARRHGGTGLAGLAEWVTALDGTMTAGPVRPSGWRVRVVVPA